ncbi:MAG: hypothetical protein IH600_08510 [Bacteroidetes bacterium]|nr:hypothetical protein [Bacteroidota bacterium]
MKRMYDLLLRTAALLLLLSPQPIAAQDGWEATDGPYGGSVQDMIFLNDQTMLAGTYYGGLYRSTDAGTSWTLDALRSSTVNTLYRLSATILLAGLDNGISISHDNGVTWGAVTAAPEGFILSIDGDSGGLHYAAGRDGLFRSFDAGDTWQMIDLGTQGARGLCVCVGEDDVLFVGLDNAGMLRSTDQGDTWQLADPAFTGERVAAIARKGQTLFASVWTKGLYCSTDNGQSWTRRCDGISDLRASAFLMRENGDVLAGTAKGEIWRSTDLGSSWSLLANPYDNSPVYVLREFTPGNLYCGMSGGGVARSTDGGQSWTHSSSGMTNIATTDMLVDAQGTLYVGFRSSHLMKSTDHGQTWKNADELYGARLLAAGPSGTLYCAREYQGVSHTTDGGASWIPDTAGMPNPRFNAIGVGADGHVYAGMRNPPNLHLPPGAGQWQQMSDPLRTERITGLFRTHVNMFAGTADAGLYRAYNEGIYWTRLGNGLNGNSIQCLVEGTNDVYCATEDGIYRSTDEGDSWQRNARQPGFPVMHLAILLDGSIVACTREGVYIQRDAESGWDSFHEGLPVNNVAAIAADADGMIYVRTEWHGIYRRNTLPTGMRAAPPLPEAVLYQSFPHPVLFTTIIRFSLPRPMTVSLIVTDARGRDVARLRDHEHCEGGTHHVRFDASALPSGLYLYRLEAGGTMQMRRMVLMR